MSADHTELKRMGLSSITTVDSTDRSLGLASLPLVDLRFLSQTELRSLSLCRDDAFDLRCIDDLVAPVVDRSIFNESDGTRRQTYSRRRSPPLAVAGDDPELRENKKIVGSLRQLLSQQQQSPVTLTLTSGDRPPPAPKRRERASSASASAVVVYRNEYEVVNRSGGVVDVAALAVREDPFGAELTRRTEGLETEVELLGFLDRLQGQWGSRRKKRKIVDAGDFGDELPVGWKLLLGLKRREGRVSLNCRRYISPNGQQFMSCKEVSSYLLPYSRPQEVNHPVSSHIEEHNNGTCNMVTGSTSGPTSQVGIGMEAPICYSATPISSISTDYEKQIVLFRVENPAKALLRNLLECRKCNLSFSDKDSYVQHLLSFHKRNAKRCRVGKSIADGVIIKDGEYECQFCHKTFDEKRRYNSHVGIHVRDYDKSLDSLPDDIIVQTCIQPTTFVLMPSAITEIDALGGMGIAKDSTTAISMAKSSYEPDQGSPHTMHNKEDAQISVAPQKNALEALPSTSIDEQDNGCEMIDDELERIIEADNTIDDQINNCTDARISISSEAANVTCDAYRDKVPSPCSMLDGNDKSDKDQNRMGCYLDVLPANEQTHGADASYDLPDENDKSGNEENGTKSYLDTLPDNKSTHCTRTCDAFPDNDLSVCRMLDKNDKSGNEKENVTKSYLDSLPDNMPTHRTCGVFHGNDPSPCRMLDENDISGNDENGSKSYLKTVPNNDPTYGNEKDLSPSSTLDENDNSGYEQEKGIGTCLYTLSYSKPTPRTTCMNKVGKSSNELNGAIESCSVILPDSEQTCTETSVEDILNSTMKEGELDLMEKFGKGMESDLGSCYPECEKEVDAEIITSTHVENGLNKVASDATSLLLRSSNCFPSINMISDKGKGFSSISRKVGHISDFSELVLNEIEPPNFGFATSYGSASLSEPQLDLAAYGAELELGLVPSVSYQWGTAPQFLPKMGSRYHLTTLCVWCRKEFDHDGLNLELQSDSVGFICPTCKARFSGQIDVLDNGLSMNPNGF